MNHMSHSFSLCGYCLPSSVNLILPVHLLLLHFLTILQLPATLCQLICPLFFVSVSHFTAPSSPPHVLPNNVISFLYCFLLQPYPHALLLPLPLLPLGLTEPLVNPRSSVPEARPNAIQTE